MLFFVSSIWHESFNAGFSLSDPSFVFTAPVSPGKKWSDDVDRNTLIYTLEFEVQSHSVA